MKSMIIKNIVAKGLLCCGAAVALTASFTSCRFEEDDYFNESASLRVEHTNEAVKKILVNAPQGWVMQYYANTGDEGFEGFNLFAKFEENGKVTMASNHRMLRDGNANKYTEASSLYEMLLEDGPVLAFNTWNDILTPFVDPVDPSSAPGTLVKDGAGMGGDHNFVIKSYNDNELILRGERYSAEIRLKKCETSWEEYIAATNEMKNYITNTSISNYYVISGTDTLYMLSPRSGHFRIAERVNDPLRYHWVACCYTPDGFRMEYQDTVGTSKFQEFTLAEDKNSLQNEDGSVKVLACWDKYIVDCSSSWRISPETFTAEQASLYAQMEAEVKKVNSNYVLDSIAIGRTTETQSDNSKISVPGLILCVHGPARMGRVPQYRPYVVMNIDRPQYGQIAFSAPSEDKAYAAMEVYNATELKNMCNQFARTIWGVYELIPDGFFNPSVADLKPLSGGTPIRLKLK